MSQPLKPLRILIIEDSFVSAVLYQVKIARREPDFEVHLAANMADGLREHQRFEPHIVILDLGLPDSVTDESLVQIQAFKTTSKVLAMSADDTLEQAALAAGADDFMAKIIGESATPFINRILKLAPEDYSVPEPL